MSKQSSSPIKAASPAVARPSEGRVLQRKCACGQHTPGGGDCSMCSKDRPDTLRRSAISREAASDRNDVPSIVHEVLRSNGQPLDEATRQFHGAEVWT